MKMNKALVDRFGEEWADLLKELLESNYFAQLGKEVSVGRFSSRKIFPSKDNIFRVFKLCPPSKVKVIVLGRGVYDDGTSNGVPFSSTFMGMNETTKSFLKEIENDIYNGFILDQDPDLTRLAEQGVLFLGTSLTVEKGKIEHSEKVWRKFIQYVLQKLSDTYPALVYIIRDEIGMAVLPEIDRESNYVIHTSNVLKDTTFSRTNEILVEIARALGMNPEEYKIKW
jgi:uracil-DNA glycosylase